MDPESLIEATAETAKAANKFAEIIQRIKGPRWTKKQAEADAYADERKLQTIRDNPDMEIVYINGELNARERTPEALAFRAQQRQIADSIRREQNIENVLQFAANEIAQISDEPVSDAPVDDDWITRFFDISKDISSEELQFIWSKILSGEIKQPGSFSLRTLEVIKSLSRAEAEVFQKVAPLVMMAGELGFILSNQDFLKRHSVYYSNIQLLDDCGLIISNEHIALNYKVISFREVNIRSKDYLIKVSGLSDNEISFSPGVYSLTTAGMELLSIIDTGERREYVINLAEEFFSKYPVNISIHKVQSIHGTTTSYESEPIKVFQKS